MLQYQITLFSYKRFADHVEDMVVMISYQSTVWRIKVKFGWMNGTLNFATHQYTMFLKWLRYKGGALSVVGYFVEEASSFIGATHYGQTISIW